MRSTYNFGILGEYIAMIYLLLKGYKILKKRFKTKLGEIDIIAEKGQYIIVVEVKTRKNKNIEINEVVKANQTKRIINTIKIFLNNNSRYCKYNIRFDIILISFFKIKHLQNAWHER